MKNAAPAALTLIVGLAQASDRAALADWVRARPATQRWAVVVDSGLAGASLAQALDDERVRVLSAGGCACCSGAVVLRATLVRLLREGGWHRLVVVAGGAARLAPLQAAVGEAPFAAHLRLEQAIDLAGAPAGGGLNIRLRPPSDTSKAHSVPPA